MTHNASSGMIDQEKVKRLKAYAAEEEARKKLPVRLRGLKVELLETLRNFLKLTRPDVTFENLIVTIDAKTLGITYDFTPTRVIYDKKVRKTLSLGTSDFFEVDE